MVMPLTATFGFRFNEPTGTFHVPRSKTNITITSSGGISFVMYGTREQIVILENLLITWGWVKDEG